MKFQVNPGEKLMKKDDNNKLIRSFINFPNIDTLSMFFITSSLQNKSIQFKSFGHEMIIKADHNVESLNRS